VIVDLEFVVKPVGREVIPTDHGYLLYGAITQAIPALHGSESNVAFAIHPIRGVQMPGRETELGRQSALAIRLDHERIPLVLPLAGRTLRIGAAGVTVGVPNVHPLAPATVLQSRLAVIKGFTEPQPFLEAAQRQVDALGVEGHVLLVERATSERFERRSTPAAGGPVRRTLRIRNKEIVGFAVRVSGLSPADSVTLQARGIGGRQHFGCGILTPVPATKGRRS
jgi:CRISPR-associated endonuclease/helicase Cas3